MREQSPKQYQMDHLGLAGEPDPTWQSADQYDGGSPLGLHDTSLFDMNESASGSLYDEATGNPYDNSTGRKASHLHAVKDAGDNTSPDVEGYEARMNFELDEAEFYFDLADRMRTGHRPIRYKSSGAA